MKSPEPYNLTSLKPVDAVCTPSFHIDQMDIKSFVDFFFFWRNEIQRLYSIEMKNKPNPQYGVHILPT